MNKNNIIKKELEYLYFNIYNIKIIKKKIEVSEGRILINNKLILKQYRSNLYYVIDRLSELDVNTIIQNDTIIKANNDKFYDF